MPFKTFAHGGAIFLAMDRPCDELRIIIERTNDGVLFQKGERHLPSRLSLEQFP